MRSSKLVLLIALVSVCVPAFAYDWSTNPGDGSPENPYQISEPNHLAAIGSNANLLDKHFVLTADVNMVGETFSRAVIAPSANYSDSFQGVPFTGTFDGSGHKITNFSVLATMYRYVGLFGQINSGGKVCNLGLENFSVSGPKYVGGLAGNNNAGSITNCYSTGRVKGVSESYYVGGLVGYNGGSITNCCTVPQSSSLNIGGYVDVEGHEPPDQISGYFSVGGLAGCNAGNITTCYSTFHASGSGGSSSIGGLAGINTGSISDCYSTGTATGESGIGGFAGSNTGSITDCFSTGQVNGYHLLIGGFSGQNLGGSITRCYSTGIVNGSGGASYVGGLVGDNDSGGSIGSCYSTGTVSVSSNGISVGGLVGGNYASNIINCYSISSVSGYDKVGGLVGRIWNGGSIRSCFSTGQTSGSTHVGGLVGADDTGSSTFNSFWDTQTSTRLTSAGGIGKTTIQMKTKTTFTDPPANWDFLGESINGQNEIWRMCADGVDYPRLSLEFARNGDFACGDDVDLNDLLVLAEHWLMTETNNPTAFSYAADANADTKTNIADLSVLSGNWP